ncbi:8963_t:CDS:10 [Entrophospora sp. SA101]|nr:8963_t:CDS:10 [Entrophospora sp. SA101]
MGKRPFIDRKTAKHYHLVHRSQRDPLINDSDVSSRVLVEVIPPNLKGKVFNTDNNNNNQQKQIEIESRAGQAALYGIYYDDTKYDYLQHLKTIGENSDGIESIFIEASSKDKKNVRKGGNIELVENQDEEETKNKDTLLEEKDPKIPKKDRKVTIILPDEVLPSKYEMPIGLLNQTAIPHDIQGFQPDMDPNLREVLEALEDDAFVDNELNDEFFQKLDEEKLFDFQEFDIDGDDEEDGFESENEKEGWELEFKKKSRTTGGYSMTSSIMYRNDKLRLLDEQFEKIEKDYMSEETSDSETSIKSSQVRNDFSEILDEFLDKYEIKGRKMLTKPDGETSTKQLELIRQELSLNKNNSKNNIQRKKDLYVKVQSEGKHKDRQIWDCQSILSTYSNLENHPILIREQKHHKRIDIDLNLGLARPKGESKEEKKSRKEMLKDS